MLPGVARAGSHHRRRPGGPEEQTAHASGPAHAAAKVRRCGTSTGLESSPPVAGPAHRPRLLSDRVAKSRGRPTKHDAQGQWSTRGRQETSWLLLTPLPSVALRNQLDRICLFSGRIGRIPAKFGRVRANFGRRRFEVRPTPGQTWPKLEDVGPAFVEMGSSLVDVGPNLAGGNGAIQRKQRRQRTAAAADPARLRSRAPPRRSARSPRSSCRDAQPNRCITGTNKHFGGVTDCI